jgi:hypothetical protein
MPNRTGRPSRAPLLLAALAAPLALAACREDPVAWDEAAERRVLLGAADSAAAAAGAALAPDQEADALLHRTVAAVVGAPDTVLRVDAPDATALPATFPAAPATGLCPTSVRIARGRGAERVAAWWAERPDRSAVLWSARSADGTAWDRPVAVDTLDRSGSGCQRPAPGVAVDTANGYVHLAYSLTAPEGKGVFYAHRMDPRAPNFEVPQVIVYGERPAATWIASAGDVVLVAYEDPNTGGRPFVSLALSRTGGHTWDQRFEASAGSMSAERPFVALRGRDVALGWVERTAPRELATTDDARTATAARPTGVVVRVGRLR